MGKYLRKFQKSTMRNSVIGHKNTAPGDVFPGPSEFNSAMANSGNKLRLQKLVKEALKLWAGRLRRELIYCEGATSTNLTNGVSSSDNVFKHCEADTMLLSIYAKLRSNNYTGAVYWTVQTLMYMFKLLMSRNNLEVIC